MKITICLHAIKSLAGLSKRVDRTKKEKKISKIEDIVIESIQLETQEKKRC